MQSEKSTKRILVVDDESMIVELVQVNLEANGFQVSTAFNGKDALEKARAEKPDLIVMDVRMPDIDGIEVCKRLKADAATSAIPVIMISAYARDADAQKGVAAGAEVYLKKPFDLDEFLSKVREILAANGSDA